MDLQRTPATMNREVGEIPGRAPGRAAGSFRHEDHRPGQYRMLSPIDIDEARPGDTQNDDVYLIVDVLPDAVSRLKAHQVGVEFAACAEGPDRPRASVGRRGDLAEIDRISCRHTADILAALRPPPRCLSERSWTRSSRTGRFLDQVVH